jgi:hypothetical protein
VPVHRELLLVAHPNSCFASFDFWEPTEGHILARLQTAIEVENYDPMGSFGLHSSDLHLEDGCQQQPTVRYSVHLYDERDGGHVQVRLGPGGERIVAWVSEGLIECAFGKGDEEMWEGQGKT